MQKQNNTDYKSLKIKINNQLPVMHGFLINDRHLIWSFLGYEDKHLTGGDKFYHYDTSDNELGQYHIDIFKGWFDLCWQEATEIEINS